MCKYSSTRYRQPPIFGVCLFFGGGCPLFGGEKEEQKNSEIRAWNCTQARGSRVSIFQNIRSEFRTLFLKKKTSLAGSPSGFYSPVLLRNRGQYCPREGEDEIWIFLPSTDILFWGGGHFSSFTSEGNNSNPSLPIKNIINYSKKSSSSLCSSLERKRKRKLFSLLQFPSFLKHEVKETGIIWIIFSPCFSGFFTCHSKCSQREAIPPLLFPLPSPHDTRFHKKISGKFVFALQLLWNQYGAVQPHPSQFHFAPPRPGEGKSFEFFGFSSRKIFGKSVAVVCELGGREFGSILLIKISLDFTN